MMTVRAILPWACALLVAGCATPVVHEPSRTTILDPDAEDSVGGSFLESSDIRTIAQQMTMLSFRRPRSQAAVE